MTVAQFDQAAAQAAITALEDTVTLLQQQGSNRDRLATKALDQWSGADANSFRGSRYPGIKSQTATTISRLNSLITQIGDASTKALNATPHPMGGRQMPS
ncbi:MAG: hypothetical protein WAM30_00500 [Candidatus Dormiibacterota bacterium]